MIVPAATARRDVEVAGDSAFLRDVMAGLTARSKYLLPKYFYDETGARLFEEITTLPEYYPTRCELEILRVHGSEIAAFVPTESALIEFGSGSSRKVRLLLAAAPTIAAYVPVDISHEMLAHEAQALMQDHPRLAVLPVAADFTRPFDLPPAISAMPRIGFFPGSTLGNFEPKEAVSFLRHAAEMLGSGSAMIIGVDLVKDPAVLNAAYNDAAGVTARFNLNLLARINHELGADFDLRGFRHHAFYDCTHQRIEMHLVSRAFQTVHIAAANATVTFARDESIWTESSYKYLPDQIVGMGADAGFATRDQWIDADARFALTLMTAM
jgi:dimethylhistidine N-methyltransferase